MDDLTIPASERLGDLAVRTMHDLRIFFDRSNHHPSPGHWMALEDIAGTMEAMADGKCSRKVFLSAVDPGVGKSQTVTHFARALLSSAARRNVGMIICVARINEACDLADALADQRANIAVLTSDEEANAKGGITPEHAQVLITTQQRIERAAGGGSFEAASTFHYRGSPRAVRVWDEAWLPGKTVTLTGDDLLLLVKPLRPLSPEFADALTEFAVQLGDVADGDAVDVPDFGRAYDLTPFDIQGAVAGTTGALRDEQQIAAAELMALSGQTVRVRLDGKTGTTMLTYRDTMPTDLLPLLVLDASGRVRETYGSIERHRGNLVRLRPATKDYSPLTVHLWGTSGAKSGFANRLPVLAKGIADTILTKPDEQWLAVVHKPGGKVKDVEKAIRRQLPATVGSNLRVITWGQHMATNAYADVPNVILAGTLFMRDSYYTALAHLTKDRDVAPGLVSRREVVTIMRGEHADLILQALCRGRVRRSDGAKCLPMDAYLIASSKSGITKDITRIFPGCRVVPWTPVKKELTGRIKAAVEYVRSAIGRGATWISFRSIHEGLEMDRTNFRKWVLNKDDWKDAIAQMGLETGEGPRRAMGLRVVDHEAAAD